MIRKNRETEEMFASLGVAAVKLRQRTHAVYRLTNRYGVTKVYVLPKSPSDWRGMKNKRAQLRRFAEEKPCP